MSGKDVLLVDASVFIEAARRYYAFDLAPGFWNALVQHAGDGNICSIDRVKAEIDKGRDELTKWANSAFRGAFLSTNDDDVARQYALIMRWVADNPQFFDPAKTGFADGADGWVVAYAKAKGHVVVTQEVMAPETKRKVPIPNVCHQFKVRCMDTFEMLRILQIRLK